MRKRELNAATLAAAFGGGSPIAETGVTAFLESLHDGQHTTAVVKARERWIEAMRAVFGSDPRRVERGLRSLTQKHPDGDGADPHNVLFAVQTYYALIVKFLVWQAVAQVRQIPPPAEILLNANRRDAQLRQDLEDLESQFAWWGAAADLQDLWAWYLQAWTEAVASWFRAMAEVWSAFDFSSIVEDGDGPGDLLQAVYQSLFPRRFRHALGEYYTPPWLVEQLLDEAGYTGSPDVRLLDPACGSGGFLVAAIRRLRSKQAVRLDRDGAGAAALLRVMRVGIVGIDLNPLAVLTARANYLLAVLDLLSGGSQFDVPVIWGDSILGHHEPLPGGTMGFDYVVGNPPWIAWDDLPSDLRRATAPLWRRYGLFTLSATDARHGGGKKDLSMLMIHAAADRYLKSGGRLAMVVTQTVFQTRGAGDGFRRFQLGDQGEPLKVLRVNDFVDRKPFPGASNWSATILLEKGSETLFPVPYVKYLATGGVETLQAMPVDSNRPNSPWFVVSDGWYGSTLTRIGPSDYEAHLGANTGGANGVYWVALCSESSLDDASRSIRVRNLANRGKQPVEVVEHRIERGLLFPLVRWTDVDRFSARPSAWLILPQDISTRRGIAENTFREQYPNAYAYFSRFRELLIHRAAYRRYQSQAAFYSMYDVGPYTLAPFKVVWRRMDRRIRAAVLGPFHHPSLGERPIVPQETCALVATDSADEAHYLCAILNSAPVDFLIRSHSVRGGKGFGSPGMFEYLRIRRYDPTHAIHRALAAASKSAHETLAAGGNIANTQGQIDAWVSELWTS